MTAWRAAVPALLLFASSCALPSSRLQQADLPMPASYAEESGPRQEAVAAAPWWRAFRDPLLDALLAEALANNQDLAQAAARVAQLQALAQADRARLFPVLTLGGRAGREQNLGQGGESIGQVQTLSLAAAYEVDFWGRIGASARAASLAGQAAALDARAQRLSIAAQVADFYFLAREKRAQLLLVEESIRTLTDLAARVEHRYEAGLVGAADLYQARQNLLEVREGRPEFEAALAVAEHGLAILLGRFPHKDLSGKAPFLPEAPAPRAAGLPASLLQNRPDIEAAFQRLAASDAEVAAAIAARLPAVNLMAGYGLSRLDVASLPVSGIIWNLLAEFSQPLFDAGRRRAEVARQEAVFAERLAAYRQAVLLAVREVEDALARNRGAEERLALLAARSEASTAALRLVEEEYFAGLGDYLPVLIARQLSFRDESSLLAAQRQLLAERIALARSLGGGSEEETPEQERRAGLQPPQAERSESHGR